MLFLSHFYHFQYLKELLPIIVLARSVSICYDEIRRKYPIF